MREVWREVKWESRSDQEREKEERREEDWDWRSSKAFLRSDFFESICCRATEIVSRVVAIGDEDFLD